MHAVCEKTTPAISEPIQGLTQCNLRERGRERERDGLQRAFQSWGVCANSHTTHRRNSSKLSPQESKATQVFRSLFTASAVAV